jgi:hypothetical protein
MDAWPHWAGLSGLTRLDLLHVPGPDASADSVRKAMKPEPLLPPNLTTLTIQFGYAFLSLHYQVWHGNTEEARAQRVEKARLLVGMYGCLARLHFNIPLSSLCAALVYAHLCASRGTLPLAGPGCCHTTAAVQGLPACFQNIVPCLPVPRGLLPDICH